MAKGVGLTKAPGAKGAGKWIGQVYVGKRGDGSTIRKKKTFYHPHNTDGRKAAMAEFLPWKQAQQTQKVAGYTTTLDDLFGMFIARMDGKDHQTIATYEWSRGLIEKYGLGGKTIASITVRDVEFLLIDLATKQGLTKDSIGRVRHHLRSAFKYAQRDDWVTKNVAELADLPNRAKASRARKAMTVDQAREFLQAAESSRLGPALNVGMMRALRPGELLALTWEDVDIDAAPYVLRVRHAVDIGEDGGLTLGPLKRNYQSDRVPARRDLQLDAHLASVLQDQRRTQAEQKQRAGGMWDTTYENVFATRNGTLISTRNFRRECYKILAATSIRERFTPYEILRHTGLSILNSLGVSSSPLQDLAGHTDGRMLANTYLHNVERDGVDAGMDAISEALHGV